MCTFNLGLTKCETIKESILVLVLSFMVIVVIITFATSYPDQVNSK